MKVSRDESTEKAYKDKWKELMKFFYLIGDYQSAMLVDRENCPNQPLPFRPESFAMYLDYRCGDAGTPLKKPNGDNQLDVRGQEIKVIGGWQSPSSMYKIHAAVLFLHEIAYPETCGGPYQNLCEECERLNLGMGGQLQGSNDSDELQADDDDTSDTSKDFNARGQVTHALGLFRSCIQHANVPSLRTRGCILRHPATMNHYKLWLKLIQKHHVTKGCGQLYPSEVRRLRDHLLARGDPVSIQIWVMILLGIQLFLRADELVTLTIEDFIDSYYPEGKKKKNEPGDGKDELTKCQVIQPDSIEAVAVEVQGKTDKKPVRLVLLSNDEYPEFCPIRHLLWYIKIFNIRSGYLFPDREALISHWQQRRAIDFHPDTHMSYGSFLSMYKNLIGSICHRDTKIFQVGTHTSRKTGYLFAVWGFLTGVKLGSYDSLTIPYLYMSNVMKSARHSTVSNASTYQRDASTLFELVQRERHNMDNKVGMFKSIFLEIGTHGSAVTSSAPYQKPLPELARWWYSTCLGLRDRPVGNNPVEILLLACNVRPRCQGLDEIKVNLLNCIPNPSKVNGLMDQIQNYLDKERREITARILQDLEASRSQPREASQEVLSPAAVPQKRRIIGTIDFHNTKKRKGERGNDHINFLLEKKKEFIEKTGGQQMKLTESARRWYSRHVVKCLMCLEDHLKGDRATFLEIYGEDFTTTRWSCRCGHHQQQTD